MGSSDKRAGGEQVRKAGINLENRIVPGETMNIKWNRRYIGGRGVPRIYVLGQHGTDNKRQRK